MYTLSAADAISPAIQRTKTFLFKPFRWGTFLKLSLVAVLTDGFGGNFNSPGGGGGHGSSHAPNIVPPFHFSPGWIAAIVAAVALALLLGLVIFYLITRLRFAFFHCLIHNIKEIRPGWHLYRTQAGRFFWLNIVLWFCFMLVIVAIAVPFAAGFWRLVNESHPGGGPIDLGLLLSLILPLIPIILLLMLIAFAADLILRDFMLPHYALENATARQAWTAAWTRIKQEKGQFVLYAVLRVILPIAAMIGLVLVLIIPGIICAGITVGVEIAIHSAFEGATGAAAVGLIALGVLVGAIAIGIFMLAVVCVGGPLSTAIRQYALLFYGGRYPALGDSLFPPMTA